MGRRTINLIFFNLALRDLLISKCLKLLRSKLSITFPLLYVFSVDKSLHYREIDGQRVANVLNQTRQQNWRALILCSERGLRKQYNLNQGIYAQRTHTRGEMWKFFNDN